ncbi:hypothetical protein HY988_05580 [Candidatus Micrarchaeota archaeon]|nr:hypothetical protein [Candidatus Micrarchaeota archaeon]
MEKHDIICDSGALISLTAGCLDRLLYFFSEKYHVRFLIPPCVEYESVKHPIESRLLKYLFSAMRIKEAIEDGVVIKIDANLDLEAKRLMGLANNIFYLKGKPLTLIQQGEAEMLALAKSVDVSYVLIDERTTRLLIEAPFKLKEHFEQEFHVSVMVNKKNLQELSSLISHIKAIRSSELVMLAYEKGYFSSFASIKKDALEAALYKMKYSGCAISFNEIKDYLKSVE